LLNPYFWRASIASIAISSFITCHFFIFLQYVIYKYDKLRKTISINILNFDYVDEEEFHNVYKVYNEKSKKELSSVFEMHFIDLNKFKKDFKDVKTALDRWVVFLNRAYELEKDKIPEELAADEILKKAVEKLDVMYLNKEEREIYENDLKSIRDEMARLMTAEIRGLERGMEKGAVLSRREDIIDNLNELEPVTDEIAKTINNEEDIEVLKKWLKISARVDSLDEFIRKIRE
jgi:predicted transposase/invertase (TIGR01784 family)